MNAPGQEPVGRLPIDGQAEREAALRQRAEAMLNAGGETGPDGWKQAVQSQISAEENGKMLAAVGGYEFAMSSIHDPSAPAGQGEEDIAALDTVSRVG